MVIKLSYAAQSISQHVNFYADYSRDGWPNEYGSRHAWALQTSMSNDPEREKRH